MNRIDNTRRNARIVQLVTREACSYGVAARLIRTLNTPGHDPNCTRNTVAGVMDRYRTRGRI